MSQPIKRNPVPKRRPTKQTIKKSSKVFDFYMGVSGFGVLAGIIAIVIFFPFHVITVPTIFKMVFACGLITNVVLLPIVLRKNQKGIRLISEIGIPFYAILNIIGGGSFITGLILHLNFAGKSQEINTEIYALGERDENYNAGTYNGIVYRLQDNFRPEEVDFRWFNIQDNYKILKKKFIQLDFKDGLFGIEIFEGRGAVSDIKGSNYEVIPLLGDGY